MTVKMYYVRFIGPSENEGFFPHEGTLDEAKAEFVKSMVQAVGEKGFRILEFREPDPVDIEIQEETEAEALGIGEPTDDTVH